MELELGKPEELDFGKSKLHLSKISQHFVGLICGSRKSGKTCVILDLLFEFFKDRFSLIIIISPTWGLQKQCEVIIFFLP